MKRITYALIMLCMVVSLSNCKKSLDIPVKSAYTLNTYFVDNNTINQAVIATYATLLHQGLWAREWYFTFDLLGYEAKNAQPLQGDILQISQMTFGATQPQMDQTWSSLFRMAFRANTVLKVDSAWKPTAATDITAKAQFEGEAKFMRALAYFNLVNLYGRVPLHSSYDQTIADTYPKRAPVAAIWAQIEKDLSDAETLLPVSYDNNNLGRATKGAATALLGKSYLYEKKWAAAQTELTKLTVAPFTYALDTSYLHVFSETNQSSPENVFQVLNTVYDASQGGSQYYVFGGQESWGGKATNSDRAQEYGFNDWGNVYITNTAVKAFTYPNPVTGITYQDPRAKFTFYGDAASGGQTGFCQTCKLAATTTKPVPYDFKRFGYRWLKYETYDKDSVYGGPKSGINAQVIRYADVLLMLAESYIQQGNTGAQPLALINQIRARPSVNAVPYTALGSQAQAMNILMLERQLELTGEQVRYFDLVRWGLAKQVINAERSVEDPANPTPFQDKNLLFPIPVSEISSNPNISGDIANSWN